MSLATTVLAEAIDARRAAVPRDRVRPSSPPSRSSARLRDLSYRDVSNRHAHKTSGSADQHGHGH